ncbi:MAG: ChaN family lipoprotein [Magnetospiraceae bacterium]
MSIFTRRVLLRHAPVFAALLVAGCTEMNGSAPAAGTAPVVDHSTPASSCVTAGKWTNPANQRRHPGNARVIASLAQSNIVLLGESHDRPEHHSWQLQTLSALHGYRSKIVLGFEMFPRETQPVLDKWVRGDLTAAEFLREANWYENWNFPAHLYMPLFQYARQNHIPMKALNVKIDLIRAVRQEGWENVPLADRAGLSTPALASDAYKKDLREIFESHAGGNPHGGASAAPTEAEKAEMEIQFDRFVQAQLTWDRAMAEGLDKARTEHPDALVVGIIGGGHLQYGYGVPHQLTELRRRSVAVALPWDVARPCEDMTANVANYVFGTEPVDESSALPPPRLGVMIAARESGVLVEQVLPGSIAKKAGLRRGDLIVSAAGEDIRRNGDLIMIVQRQAPGTWLPLSVTRQGKTLEVIAKFPQPKP